MAEQVYDNGEQQQPGDGSIIYIHFLDAVRRGKEDDVKQFLRSPNSDEAVEGQEEDAVSHKRQLLDAIENEDAGTVWKLIAKAKHSDVKTIESLNETCESVAEHERLKEKGLIKNLWGKLKRKIKCTGGRDASGCKCRENRPVQTEFQHEEEQQWIRILSDPLYIGLEWLWRNNPNAASTTPQQTKRKESKLEDVIEAALDDAYLLEKIALYEHHYSRDKYTRRALECEKFAAGVVEGSNLAQLHEIMDIEGNGCLLQKKPNDFNQSLSLLKLAANKERKTVCHFSFRCVT